MTKTEQLIADLLNALNNIVRADNIDYAHGAAEFAIEKAERQMERNADGYLVQVKA